MELKKIDPLEDSDVKATSGRRYIEISSASESDKQALKEFIVGISARDGVYFQRNEMGGGGRIKTVTFEPSSGEDDDILSEIDGALRSNCGLYLLADGTRRSSALTTARWMQVCFGYCSTCDSVGTKTPLIHLKEALSEKCIVCIENFPDNTSIGPRLVMGRGKPGLRERLRRYLPTSIDEGSIPQL